jgi:hypothetical protein
MHRRHLFGPLTAEFAEDNLRCHRESEGCLTFNARGDTDLLVGPGDSWEDVCRRLPSGFRRPLPALRDRRAGPLVGA